VEPVQDAGQVEPAPRAWGPPASHGLHWHRLHPGTAAKTGAFVEVIRVEQVQNAGHVYPAPRVYAPDRESQDSCSARLRYMRPM